MVSHKRHSTTSARSSGKSHARHAERASRVSRCSKSDSSQKSAAVKPTSEAQSSSTTNLALAVPSVPVKKIETEDSTALSSAPCRSSTPVRDVGDRSSLQKRPNGPDQSSTPWQVTSSRVPMPVIVKSPPVEDPKLSKSDSSRMPDSRHTDTADASGRQTSAPVPASAQSSRSGGLSGQCPAVASMTASPPVNSLSPATSASSDTLALYNALAALNPGPCLASPPKLANEDQVDTSRGKTLGTLTPAFLASMKSMCTCQSPTTVFKGTIPRTALIVVIVSAAVLCVIVTLTLVFVVSGHPTRRDKELCVTEDCRLHAELLSEALNHSVDACEDFHAHVCSKWSPPNERRQLRDFDTSVMEDMVFSWIFRFEKTLKEGSRMYPVGRKALVMFQTCMGNTSAYGSVIQEFRDFIDSLDLSWPEPPKQDVDALSVILTLAYNWYFELWFSLRVFSVRHSMKRHRWSIALKPAPLLPFYVKHHRSVSESGKYVAYWNQFYRAFTNRSVDDNERRATEAARVEGEILEALNDALLVSPKEAAAFPISDIGLHTPSLASPRWLKHLQKTTALRPALTAQDDVVVSNVAFLVIVGEIFRNYTNYQILQLLAWHIVQIDAPVADSQLLLSYFGDQTTADTLKPVFCALHIEVAYKVMLLSMQFALQMKGDEESVIDRRFNHLVSTAVRLVNASRWLDSDSRNVLSAKLRSASVHVWPPSDYLTNESLEAIYEAYPGPGGEESFGEYWIASILNLRLTNRTPEYEYVMRLPVNYAEPYFQYDYLVNSVGVAIAAVAQPLYYIEGTSAMFYGGFGFSLALELVKAFDREGLHWHPDGRVVASILSASSQVAFDVKENCLNDSEAGDHSVFPEIPALQLAYSAYLGESNDSGNEHQVSDIFTEKQVFFLTMCYMTCRRKQAYDNFSVNCNKLVRNSVDFANAFGCPLGSKMNPVKKCVLFDET